MIKNIKGKRMVSEDLIKKLEDLQPGGGGEVSVDDFVAGEGIVIAEDEGKVGISVDGETLVFKDELAEVATSGDYDDLINKPSIPAAQVQADWNEADSSAVDYIKNKPSIPDAVSGTNDGTNWTNLTIGSDTYAIPQGGSSGNKELMARIPVGTIDVTPNMSTSSYYLIGTLNEIINISRLAKFEWSYFLETGNDGRFGFFSAKSNTNTTFTYNEETYKAGSYVFNATLYSGLIGSFYIAVKGDTWPTGNELPGTMYVFFKPSAATITGKLSFFFETGLSKWNNSQNALLIQPYSYGYELGLMLDAQTFERIGSSDSEGWALISGISGKYNMNPDYIENVDYTIGSTNNIMIMNPNSELAKGFCRHMAQVTSPSYQQSFRTHGGVQSGVTLKRPTVSGNTYTGSDNWSGSFDMDASGNITISAVSPVTITFAANVDLSSGIIFKNLPVDSGLISQMDAKFIPVDGSSIVVDANGKLASTIPAAPTADGSYHLEVTVSSGIATYAWVLNQ